MPDPSAPLSAPPRRPLGAPLVLAISLAGSALALAMAALLVSVGTLASVHLSTPSPDDVWVEDTGVPEYVEGTVTDASGAVVPGAGTPERPARLGEHTLSWATARGGIVDVTVTAVDWDAADAVAAALPDNPPASPGMVYVQAEVHVAYAGPGELVPAADVWFALETDSWSCYAGELGVVTSAPLGDVGGLVDGEEASAVVVFEMVAGERASALLSVETVDGAPLFLTEG